MITPEDISKKMLSTAQNGYNIQETDEFLDEIESSYTALYNENKELMKKIDVLATKVEEYRNDEDSIKDALLTAQKAAAEVKSEAREKSDTLLTESAETAKKTVTEAQEKANKILEDAKSESQRIYDEKTKEASDILSNAKEKASREIENAKADANALLNETKSIASDIIDKAKEENSYYSNLTRELKKEAGVFKARLTDMYSGELEKLNDMFEGAVSDVEPEQEPAAEPKHTQSTSQAESPEASAPAVQDEPVKAETVPSEKSEEKQETSPAVQADEPEQTSFDSNALGSDGKISEIDEGKAADSPQEESPKASSDEEKKSSKDDFDISDDDGTLPFEKFFNVDDGGYRHTDEKISLVPPQDDDDDDEGEKRHGFFRKKRK